jgi:hypothetical protein
LINHPEWCVRASEFDPMWLSRLDFSYLGR